MPDPSEIYKQSIPQLQLLWAEYQESSDRAICVLAGSLIEPRIEALLAAYLLDDRVATEELLPDSQPLGTFSAQTKLAFTLGLITRKDFRRLTLLRKIRNHAAHKVKVSFTCAPIKDFCAELGFNETASELKNSFPAFANAPIEKIALFNFVSQLVTYLDVWTQIVAEQQRRRELGSYTSSPGKQLGTT